MCVAIPPNGHVSEPGRLWLWLSDNPWRLLSFAGLAATSLAWSFPWESATLGFYLFGVWPFFLAAISLTLLPRHLGQATTYDYTFQRIFVTQTAASLGLGLGLFMGDFTIQVIGSGFFILSVLILMRHHRWLLFWSNRRSRWLAKLVLASLAMALTGATLWGGFAQIGLAAVYGKVGLILAALGLIFPAILLLGDRIVDLSAALFKLSERPALHR